MAAQIDALVRAIAASAAHPLVAVGSGGSLSVAQFAATLHQSTFGEIAKAMTPLEVSTFPLTNANTSFLLVSAGGGNPDIMNAFKHVVGREPRRLIILTARSGTALSQLAASYRYVDYVEIEIPSGKDGFLATNSLVAFCIAISRAYAISTKENLPADFSQLIGGDRRIENWREICRPLWERDNLVVLFPPRLQAAALDIESKFTEAALGNVHIADYRHLAHGRHHWLAKRGASTGILAFVTPDTRQLAERTIRLMPPAIPVVSIDFPCDGVNSSLGAITTAILITGFAGEARGIDPGRPGVPSFGRKIYHLRIPRNHRSRTQSSRAQMLSRKTGGIDGKQVKIWERFYRHFVGRLSRARFRGAVFDYDGTLCDERERFIGPHSLVVKALLRLLENQIPIGIATGRGKSAKNDLQRAIPPSYWNRVVIGYYSGYETGLLDDDTLPTKKIPQTELQSLGEQLQLHPSIAAHARCEIRAGQISVVPVGLLSLATIWQVVEEIVARTRKDKFAVVMSGHAVDVIPAGVSKLAVVSRLRECFSFSDSEAILCIGDRGRPPGNDHILLAQPYALSVDEVSADPDTCWNLAPPGHRGVQALLDYVDAFRVKDRCFKFVPKLIGKGKQCEIN